MVPLERVCWCVANLAKNRPGAHAITLMRHVSTFGLSLLAPVLAPRSPLSLSLSPTYTCLIRLVGKCGSVGSTLACYAATAKIIL